MKHLLYSTQSSLAYRLSKRYFNNCFYVYCSEHFASQNPASSSPLELYQLYRQIAERGDRGNPKVLSQKNALKAVALMKLQKGEIAQIEYDDLVWEIEHAESREFAPVLFLIIRDMVKHRVVPVKVSQRASSASEEFIIEGLDEQEFEAITTQLILTGGI